MIKFKKLTAIILSLVMMTTISTSCTKSENQTFNKRANGEYVPTKKLELTVWNTQGTDYVPKEIENNVVEDWLVDKTKVKIKNMYGNDGGQWDSKLTKLVAGDNLPELVYCSAGQGPAHFTKLDELGEAWELTPEMIQKYAPNVWKRTPAHYWDRIKVNGKILGIPFNSKLSKETLPDLTEEELELVKQAKIIPTNDVMAQAAGSLYIRDDILKEFYPEAKSYDELVSLLKERQEPIGEELLDIPIKTTDEYIKFMYDIKNANLKENGRNVYAFGYSGGDNWEALSWLGAEMCGYKTHFYTSTWNDVKKRIEVPLVGDMVRQAAKLQNKMINDNVIDPESLAHNMVQFEEKVMNGQYAICAFVMLGEAAATNKQLEIAGKPYRYRPFITQVPNQKEYKAYEEEALWVDSVCMLKTMSQEEVYQVLNWMDVQYTDEYEDIKNWGPKEADLYIEKEDGTREFRDEKFTKYYIEKDATALTPEETMGLQGPIEQGYREGGLFGVSPTFASKWTPEILLKKVALLPASNSGFKFPINSEHVKNVKTYPPCQAWSSVYAEIPEVVTYWAERGQWENMFKLALAAQSTDFDNKWNEAIASLNKMVDIKTMEDKMTEVARPIAEQILAGNN